MFTTPIFNIEDISSILSSQVPVRPSDTVSDTMKVVEIQADIGNVRFVPSPPKAK
jgi:hypothetical protein